MPIRGDKVLPQSIETTFAAGREAALPLIIGNTSNDSSVVAAFGIDTGEVLKRLGAAGFLVKMLYPGVKDDGEIARQATRDLVFTMPVRGIADRHSKRAPTWRYYFDYVAVKQRPDFPLGVGHGAEIPYFLDTGDIFEGTREIFTDADRALARRASDYLFSFAKDGQALGTWCVGLAQRHAAARPDHGVRRQSRSRIGLHAGAAQRLHRRKQDRRYAAGTEMTGWICAMGRPTPLSCGFSVICRRAWRLDCALPRHIRPQC